MKKVWFITGAGRGLGKAFADEALSHGDAVVAAGRSLKKLEAAFCGNENVLCVELDVSVPDHAEAAVKAAVDRFGRIDVLINNAGYGLFGALEEVSDAETRTLFDTCVFGLLNVTRAVIPVMRAQLSGKIINVSSKAGIVGDPGDVVYNAAKFAVTGASEGLKAELSDWGIDVMCLCPGPHRTDFKDSSSRREAAKLMPEYEGKLGHRALELTRSGNHEQPNDPKKTAAHVYEVAALENMPSLLIMGEELYYEYESKLKGQLEETAKFKDISCDTKF